MSAQSLVCVLRYKRHHFTAHGLASPKIADYSQIIALIGDKDSTTRRLLEDVLSDEQEHADELSDWAVGLTAIYFFSVSS